MRKSESEQTSTSIAIVAPDLAYGGGVSTVTNFLMHAIQADGRFSVDVISLATSSSDTESTWLRDPRTWRCGVRIADGVWNGRWYRHFGARWAEIELSRYQPRRQLTDLLNSYDLVQIVAGGPAWAYVAKHVRSPVALQVATRVAVERERQQNLERGLTAVWRQLMTRAVSELETKALHAADLVFVENQWMYEYVSRVVGKSNVVYAPPGVDADFFRPGNELDRSNPYILSVGRFSDPRKNVPLLLKAYARFRAHQTDAPKLVLAGMTGPTSEDWALADQLGIRRFVEFRQGVDASELAKLYRECAMFVLSSDEEGFGMVLVEAMASGAPVISTRCGGPEGIVADGLDGRLVPVGNDDAMAQAMTGLWGAPEDRQRMGRNGRRKVEREFSMDAAGRRFLEQYEVLLHRSQKRNE